MGLILALVLVGLASLRAGPLSRLGLGSIFAFFPIVAGFIGGLQFPLANKICLGDKEKVGRTAGLIYGLDLLGSCLGAFHKNGCTHFESHTSALQRIPWPARGCRNHGR